MNGRVDDDSTAYNKRASGCGRIKIAEMARVGLAVNLIGVLVISLVFYFLGTAVLGIDTATLPTWAEAG